MYALSPTYEIVPIPDFGDASLSDQTFVIGTPISPVTLPVATGGHGTLSYSLAPDISAIGLTFDAASRTLSGTPTASGTQTYSFTVTDEAGGTSTLTFVIEIPLGKAPTPSAVGGDGSATLSWIKPLDQSIDGWQLQQNDGSWNAILPAVSAASGVATLSYTVSGLNNQSRYRFKIRAVAGSGTSAVFTPASDPVEVLLLMVSCQSTDIWCATMAAWSEAGFVGFGTANAGGSLKPDTFSFDGNAYTVTRIDVAPLLDSPRLRIANADTDAVSLKDGLAHHTIYVNDTAFVVNSGTATGRTLAWPTNGSLLTTGQSYRIRIAANPQVPNYSGAEIAARTWTQNSRIASFTAPEAVGGGSFQYAASGLPDGVVMAPSSRLISGVPASAGTGTATVTASSTNPSAAATLEFDWTVAADQVPAFAASASIPGQSFTVGEKVEQTLPAATGGDGEIIYLISPASGSASDPDLASMGLSLSDGTHILSGRPTRSKTVSDYSYVAYDSDASSPPADTDTLTFSIAITPAKAPTPAARAGNNQVTLTWENSDAGITGWEGKQGSGNWTPISPSGTTTLSHRVPGLTNDVEYSFQIRASVGTGADKLTGAASDAATATPNEIGVAVTPNTLRIYEGGTGSYEIALNTDPGSDSIQVTPTSSNDDVTFTPSSVSFDSQNHTTAQLVTVSAAQDGDTDEDFATLTHAVVRVQGGSSTPMGTADSVAVTVIDDDASAAPGTPTGLALAASGLNVALSWTSADDGNLPTTHQYRQKKDGGTYGNWTDVPNSGADEVNATSYTIAVTEKGSTYTFQVRATNSMGQSAATPAASVMVKAGVPDAPSDLMGAWGETSIALTWRQGDDGGSEITHHQYASQLSSQQDLSAYADIPDSGASGANGSSYTISGLLTDARYLFRVRAVNVFGFDESAHAQVNTRTVLNAPSFASDAAVGAQSYTVGAPITALVPPAATGGDAPLSYSLTPDVTMTGLGMDAASGTLSGTPSASQPTTSYTLTVADGDDNNAQADTDSLTFEITVAPARAPTPVATSGDSRVTLAWDRPADAGITGWQTRRDSGSWTDITPTGTQGGLTLTHRVTGLSNGTSYTFEIRAFTGSSTEREYGMASESVAGTALVDSMPDFGMQTVIGESYTVGTDIAALTLPAATGGNAPLTYTLTPGIASTGLTWSAGSRTVSGRPANSQPQTSYIWKVVDGDHITTPEDEDSISFSVTIAPDTAPTPTATAQGTSVTLTWAKPADTGISGWELFQGNSAWTGITPIEMTDGSTVTLSHKVTGLSAGAINAFSIRAYTGSGAQAVTGTASAGVIATTTTNTAPQFPTPAATRTVAENTATGTDFGNPVTATDADADDVLTYSLVIGDDAAAFAIDAGTGQLQTREPLNFEGRNSYTVEVAATDESVATGSITVTINVTDVGGEAPGKPKAPVVTPASATSVRVTWTPPTNTGPSISRYFVHYCVVSNCSWTNHGVSGAPTSTTISGLTVDTQYAVRIRARSAEGDSDWSAESRATVTAKPGQLEAPVVTARSTTSLRAAWTEPSNFGSAITNYFVHYCLASNCNWTNYDVPGLPTSTTISGLTVDTDYLVRIRARNAQGDSDWSASGKATTKSNDTPAFPQPSTTRTVAENTPAATNIGDPLTATDRQNDTLTYSRAGDDAAAFTIDAATGQLQTRFALDYETANSYTFQVRVSDSKNDAGDADTAVDDTVTVSIGVSNEDEAPVFALSSDNPRVGETVVATLSDPDGIVGTPTWSWYRYHQSTDASLPGRLIDGATAVAYTTVADDLGNRLVARVEYNDGHGDGKSAVKQTAGTVTGQGLIVSTATVTVTEVSGALRTASYWVKLSAEPQATVTVGISSDDNAVARASPASLTFTTTNWATAQTVTVTGVDDAIDNDGRSATITHTTAGFDHEVSVAVTALLTDDEPDPTVTLTLSPEVISENGAVSTVTASLNHRSSEVTLVTVSAAAVSPAQAGDFTLSSNVTLNIGPEATSSTGSVTITAVDNLVNAANKTVTVSAMADNAQGVMVPASVNLTLTNDDTEGTPPVVGPCTGVWCANLRLDTIFLSTGTYLAYHGTSGLLEPASFDYEGITYTIQRVLYRPPGSPSRELSVEFDRSPAALTALNLRVGGLKLAGSTATADSTTLRWPVTGSDLRTGETYQMRFDMVLALDRESMADQSYVVGEAIPDLTLPGATGGDAPLTYGLMPETAGIGLSLDSATLVLSGTPTTSQIKTAYTYTVTDSDSPTPGSDTLTFLIEIAPAKAPTPILATGDSGSEVTLSWEQPTDTGITGWTLKQDDGEFVDMTPNKLTVDGVAMLSHTVTGLSRGQVSFRIRAHAGSGDDVIVGEESDAAVIEVVMTPAAPTGVTATGANGRATLSWTAGADNGGAITRHEYQQKADGGSDGEWTAITDSAPGGANATSFTVSGLTNNTMYTFKVRAVNNSGVGAESVEAIVTWPANFDPVFDEGAAAARVIAENTEAGMVIGEPISATDPEGDTLHYSKVGAIGPDDSDLFSIDSNTGQLRTRDALDFEAQESYTFRVEVGDGRGPDGSFHGPADNEIEVTISVADADDAGSISFDATIPRVDTALTATLEDQDVVPGTEVTWRWARSEDGVTVWSVIASAAEQSYTPVAGDAGQYLRATATYDDTFGMDKTVAAVTAAAVLSASATNSPPAFDEGMSATRQVAENTEADTDIGKDVGTPLSATDLDAGALLTWSLGGADASSFAIDTTTGQLTTAVALDYEITNSYTVEVSVSDGKNDAGESDTAVDDTITVSIGVSNEDEDPMFDLSTDTPRAGVTVVATLSDPDGIEGTPTYTWYRYDVSTDSYPGTLIAGATAASYTPVANDVGNLLVARVYYDDGHGAGKSVATQTFTEVARSTTPDAPTELMAIGGNGQVALTWTAGGNGGSAITRHEYQQQPEGGSDWTAIEDSAPGGANATSYTVTGLTNATRYSFKVRAVNANGNGAESRGIPVTPKASNSAPVFSGDSTTREVAENTISGTDFGAAVVATDADSDTLTYSLGGADADSFHIAEASGQLRTFAELNFEARESFAVTVTASDVSNETDSIEVTISVTDTTEIPDAPDAPIVTQSTGILDSLKVTWNEPANTGPEISDYDVRYCFTSASCSVDADWTEHAHTEAVRISTISGLMESTEYEVQVRAGSAEGTSDWSESGTGTTGTNSAPEINGPETVDLDVAENTAGEIQTFTATDANNDTLTWSLSGTDESSFTIDASTGAVSVASETTLNYESGTTSYSFTVTATDGRADDAVTVTVNVTNVNEAGSLSLDSNSPVVGTALTAMVSDPDGGVSSITWRWARIKGTDAQNIGGATDAAYTPVLDDVGYWLALEVNYDDVLSAGNSEIKRVITAVPTNTVVALSFGSETVASKTWTAGSAIASFTIPATIGGSGTVTYAATGLPAGVSMSPERRGVGDAVHGWLRHCHDHGDRHRRQHRHAHLRLGSPPCRLPEHGPLVYDPDRRCFWGPFPDTSGRSSLDSSVGSDTFIFDGITFTVRQSGFQYVVRISPRWVLTRRHSSPGSPCSTVMSFTLVTRPIR